MRGGGDFYQMALLFTPKWHFSSLLTLTRRQPGILSLPLHLPCSHAMEKQPRKFLGQCTLVPVERGGGGGGGGGVIAISN